MSVYVPRNDGFDAVEEKIRVSRQSVYNTGIICGALVLALLAIGLQLEQHRKCGGISHQDKVRMMRLLDDVNR